jgi:tripartite-type tricarboxylate transporter receptor subunit TctC
MFTSLRALMFLPALIAAFICLAQAQEYPTRFIKILVGPGPDIIARFFGPKITEALGQEVVVEPKPGAGGIIAAQTVANSPPDGYTLLMSTASFTVGTALGTMPLDVRKDFVPVGLGSTAPFVLIVHPSVPAKNLGELIALAKANPGKLNYASSGIGTTPHFAGELFKSMAGLDIVHVPFREANSAINAVVSGSVQMMFSIASVAQSQIAGGTVRGLGVSTAQRTPVVPDMPTIAEGGLPGYEARAWNGFSAPLGTPAPIVAKLNAAIRRGLDDQDLQKRLRAAGYDPAPQFTPEEFTQFIQEDTQKWIDLVQKTGIKGK